MAFLSQRLPQSLSKSQRLPKDFPGHCQNRSGFPKTSPVAAKIAAAFQRLPRSLSKSQPLSKDFPGRCQNHSGFPKTSEALVENEKKCQSLYGFVVNRRPARCEVIDSKSWVLRSWGCVKSCFPPKKAYLNEMERFVRLKMCPIRAKQAFSSRRRRKK